jgi:hypothetical protein
MHAPNDSPAAREFTSFSSIVLNHTSTIFLTCYREVMPQPFRTLHLPSGRRECVSYAGAAGRPVLPEIGGVLHVVVAVFKVPSEVLENGNA